VGDLWDSTIGRLLSQNNANVKLRLTNIKNMYGKKSQIAYHISDLNKVEAFKGIDCA
jgi:hypothetical protein